MSDVTERITNYLSAGGLFNPELMDHAKVRDLIIYCRVELERLEARLAEAVRERDEAMIELNGVSPIETCARCGEQDRRHRMMLEEGDEWECVNCWDRCNAFDAARAGDTGEKPNATR